MLNNFFTGSENLFKLLFVNGILIILIGLFYPLQKRDELDIKIIEHNSSVKLLNKEIQLLYEESVSLKKEAEEYKRLPSRSKIEVNKKSKELKKKVFEQDKKTVILEGQTSQVLALQNQQETYSNYCKAFLIFGGVITILGLLGWLRLTYFEYDKEYSEFKTRNPASSTIRRSTVAFVIIAVVIIGTLIFTLFVIL